MTSTTETLLLGVVVALLVTYGSMLLWRWQFSKYLNLPPGPRALPIVGSLHLLGTHPHRSLAELASQYGPLMSVWLGQRLCIVASTAEAAKEFLKLQDANFAFRPSIQAAEIIAPGGVHSLPDTPHFL